MVRSEMLQRMSAREFNEWMELMMMDAEQMEQVHNGTRRPAEQTPLQMIQVLKQAGEVAEFKKRGRR